VSDLKETQFDRLGPRAFSTVLVIGGCGGIGHALAGELARQDCTVIIMDLPEAIARREPAGEIRTVPVDLRNEVSIESAFRTLAQSDVRLNSVAVCSGYTKGHDRIDALDTSRFDDVISGNLRGPALAMREAKQLLAQDAAIVLLTTAIGQIGAPGYAGYGAAKAGLNALVRILAAELAPEIRVNGVAPGAVDTAFIRGGFGEGADESGAPARFDAEAYDAKVPMGRMAASEDVVGPLMFLLSDAARYITGQVLHVNGGAFMRD